MLKNIAEEISLQMVTHKIIKIENREFYIYGIELLMCNLLIGLAICAIAVMTRTIIISLVFSIVFCTLRAYAGGYHCKTYSSCFLISLGIYISMLLVNIKITENKLLLSAVITVVFLPVIIIFAPVEHENNPLDPKDKVKYRKMSLIFAFVFLLFYILSLFFRQINISFSISWAIAGTAILLLISRIGGVKNEKGTIDNSSKVS